MAAKRVLNDEPELMISLSEVKEGIKVKLKRLEIVIAAKEKEIAALLEEKRAISEKARHFEQQGKELAENIKYLEKEKVNLRKEVDEREEYIGSLNKKNDEESAHMREKLKQTESQAADLKNLLKSHEKESAVLLSQSKSEQARLENKYLEEKNKLEEYRKYSEQLVERSLPGMEKEFQNKRTYWREKIVIEGFAENTGQQAVRKRVFIYKNTNAQKVEIAGQFTNWNSVQLDKHENGEWQTVCNLAPGEYEYKFVVDGKWIKDPLNPLSVDDNYGGESSVMIVL